MILKKQPIKYIVACILTLLGSAQAEDELIDLQFYGLIGIGNSQQNNSTFNLTSDEVELLTQNNEQQWNAWSLQLGLGYPIELQEDSRWFTDIIPAINFYIFNDGDNQGQVYRFEDSDDNDAAYDMTFNSTRLMFDTAVTVLEYRKASIYALAGLGVSWNDIDLSLEPYAHTGLEPLYFNNGSQTSFAYEFGAGVSYALNEDLDLLLQYLFTDFTDLDISGSSDIFTAENSNLDLSIQTLSIGFSLWI